MGFHMKSLSATLVLFLLSSIHLESGMYSGRLFFKKFIYLFGCAKVLVAAHRIFSCSMWDLVLWPGIKPRPPALEHRVLTTGTPGKSQEDNLNMLLFGCSIMSDSLQPRGLQHTRLPCLSPTLRSGLNSYPSSWWCHPTISSSVICFSFRLQSFPASESFPVSQFFSSGGQNIGVSASTSVLPMNIQGWFPLGLTSWISLQSKGLSRVFSSTEFEGINCLALSWTLHKSFLA